MVGMIFPFLVSALFALRNEDSWFYSFFVLFIFIGSPLLVWRSAYILFRCRYTLRKLAIDEQNRKIEMSYLNFRRERSLTADIPDIEIKFRRDWSTRSEYYVLEFYHKDKLIFTQFQEGDWEKDVFFRVVKKFLENEVKCTLNSYGMKKKILGHK
jgi:hypothetical protein